MGKVLVCQHVAYEILGTLNPLLKEHRFRIKYVNFERNPDAEPKIDGYDGLIILGGPMCANEDRKHPHLKTELKLIESALKMDIPILGICLGSQLLAKALGARCYENTEKEIGWYKVQMTEAGQKDSILQTLGQEAILFQWHRDTFDSPAGSEHLARSLICEQQAFRYGKHAYGFQFHLEVDAPMIERWTKVPFNQEDLRSFSKTKNVQDLLNDTRTHIDQSVRMSKQVFTGFVNHLEIPEERIILTSGHRD